MTNIHLTIHSSRPLKAAAEYVVMLEQGNHMSKAPNLQDYMLPVLKIFEDGEEHSYKEIPEHLGENSGDSIYRNKGDE